MTGDPGALRENRLALLAVEGNPSAHLDYLSRLDGAAAGDRTHVTLYYVPDKLVLPPAAFNNYLAALGEYSGKLLEQLAATILEDFNNEVVPRWLSIRLERQMPGMSAHRTLFEDQQPKWNNPALLARLERF
ncbi:MAG: hypothetical protein WD767_17065 [Alphaproteobacteria bacterium]